jgi:8-oxo-dGTP diphosphatase
MRPDRLPPYNERYPPPYISVDIAIMTAEDGVLKVVLEERDDLPGRQYLALPHEILFEPLDLEGLARRYIKDRLGLFDMPLEVAHVSGKPDRDPRGRVISVTYLALAEAALLREFVEARSGLHLVRAEFHHETFLSTLYLGEHRVEVAFDQETAIAAAIRMLRDRLDSSLMPFRLLPEEGFTILELQQVHEAILGYSLNKITFRKRVLGRLFGDRYRLVKTDLVEWGSHRPAQLYRLG